MLSPLLHVLIFVSLVNISSPRRHAAAAATAATAAANTQPEHPESQSKTEGPANFL